MTTSIQQAFAERAVWVKASGLHEVLHVQVGKKAPPKEAQATTSSQLEERYEAFSAAWGKQVSQAVNDEMAKARRTVDELSRRFERKVVSVAIMGPAGQGKSTLVETLTGLPQKTLTGTRADTTGVPVWLTPEASAKTSKFYVLRLTPTACAERLIRLGLQYDHLPTTKEQFATLTRKALQGLPRLADTSRVSPADDALQDVEAIDPTPGEQHTLAPLRVWEVLSEDCVDELAASLSDQRDPVLEEVSLPDFKKLTYIFQETTRQFSYLGIKEAKITFLPRGAHAIEFLDLPGKGSALEASLPDFVREYSPLVDLAICLHRRHPQHRVMPSKSVLDIAREARLHSGVQLRGWLTFWINGEREPAFDTPNSASSIHDMARRAGFGHYVVADCTDRDACESEIAKLTALVPKMLPKLTRVFIRQRLAALRTSANHIQTQVGNLSYPEKAAPQTGADLKAASKDHGPDSKKKSKR